MRFCRFLSVFVIFFVVGAYADSPEARFVVEISAPTVKERSALANIIHIDSIFQDRVFSVVNIDELNTLENNFLNDIVTVEDITDDAAVSDQLKPFINIADFPPEDAAFHNFDEMTKALHDFATQYPQFAQVFSIGKSIENRDIWALKISSALDEERPAIAYMGTHHAREHVSTEMPLLLAKELLEGYDTDPDTKALLDSTEIYLIPMVNPDGATFDISAKRYKYWRKNRRQNQGRSYGVDLNRNYGFGFGTGGSSTDPTSEVYMGTEAFSEPETKAIRDFFTSHTNISTALSFHTYSELILYPWGHKDTGVGGEDEVLFKTMANHMAQMNHYEPMQSSGLYIASGDTCDWLYGELSVLCFTFELSPASMFDGGFYPGASVIQPVFEANLAPMLYLANRAKNPRGPAKF